MEIDASPGAVVHDEVPRPIFAPQIRPIHPSLGENGDHLLELGCVEPEVKIRMDSSLLTEQCVHCPAARKPHVHSASNERTQQPDGGGGVHHMVVQRLRT